jgi:DNA polymerase II large subunit
VVDGNILATIGSAIGVLVGVYGIVNRTEDRLGKRIDEAKETLRAETKAAVAGLELKTVERLGDMEKRLNERIDIRLVHP